MKLKSIEEKRGNLNDTIPQMVNEWGQVKTAKALGVSPSTVNLWLKDNGYQKKIIYVKKEQQAS